MVPGPRRMGKLVVCPTPIGNLEDITERALRELAEADLIACEDTRHTGVLLERYGIAGRLVSYHDHNERARARELMRRMRAGDTVALVSDAGTPLIADPGFELVRACLAAEVPVEVLPGPCAAVTALVASALPMERFTFVGFLPRARGELTRLLGEPGVGSLVAYESPRRLVATLTLASERQRDRRAAVCRELTKIHEEVRRGTVHELAEHYREHPPRGELVLVLAPADPGSGAEHAALSAVRELVESGARPRAAAAAVARLTGVAANELYRGLTTRGSDAAGRQ